MFEKLNQQFISICMVTVLSFYVKSTQQKTKSVTLVDLVSLETLTHSQF